MLNPENKRVRITVKTHLQVTGNLCRDKTFFVMYSMLFIQGHLYREKNGKFVYQKWLKPMSFNRKANVTM